MDTKYLLLVIFLMSIISYLFRALPFLCMEFFKHHKIVIYLGALLPASVMLTLVIFSLKDVHYFSPPYGIPEISGVIATLLTHIKKRNVFLSIFIGTTVYAILSGDRIC